MLRRIVKRVVGKLRGSAARVTTPPPPAPPPTPEPIAQAETMASINADVQEVRERVEAGEPVTLLDVRTDGEVASGTHPRREAHPARPAGRPLEGAGKLQRGGVLLRCWTSRSPACGRAAATAGSSMPPAWTAGSPCGSSMGGPIDGGAA